MHVAGKTNERIVMLSNMTLRVYEGKRPKDAELLEMRNRPATKYLTKVPMFGAFNYATTVKAGYLSSRTFDVISIKSCMGDVVIDLFFDTLSENEAHSTWKKCIEDAIDSTATQLTPLTLARQQIGLFQRNSNLSKQKSKSQDFRSNNVLLRHQSSSGASYKSDSS